MKLDKAIENVVSKAEGYVQANKELDSVLEKTPWEEINNCWDDEQLRMRYMKALEGITLILLELKEAEEMADRIKKDDIVN